MTAGLNIIITGQAGTGKTTMLEEASKNLNWKMKYFSTPTLDVFSDLIGIPVPNHGRKTVDYYRPRELDEADCVFFDELNRGDMMVLNAVFEIIQFRSINGEKLDKLKCCVAAVNPVVDGYTTRQLDLALMDRFDMRLESDPNPSWDYFRGRYGDAYARAGFELYKDYRLRQKKGEKLDYFSPRRLDKMLSIFQMFPVVDSIRGVVPSEGTIDFTAWAHHLKSSLAHVAVPVADNLDTLLAHAHRSLRNNLNLDEHTKGEVFKICHMAQTADHPKWRRLKLELMQNLNKYVTGPEDLQYWSTLLKGSSAEELAVLTKDWPEAKAAIAFKLVV